MHAADHHEFSESTVRTILKNKEAILAAGKNALPLQASRLTRVRAPIMLELDKLLDIFIENNTQRRIPITTIILREKALSLYESLKTKYPQGSVEPFTASKGWFEKFKNRSNILHNILIKHKSASIYEPAASRFKKELKQIMEVGRYTNQQLFNVKETSLYWKRMPKRTFMPKEENFMSEFKTSKDRLTLLLGGNAAGDCKLTPLLVYHSKKPRSSKNTDKNWLPVHWTVNQKASITQKVFKDWFINHFSREVESFCKSKNIPFKAILLLHNAPSHPSAATLEELAKNIKVVCFPPNTTSLIQPMDQGTISTFKAYYLRNMFSNAISATNSETNPLTVHDFWKSFNIKHAVQNIGSAWDEINEKTMAAVWQKILKENNSSVYKIIAEDEIEKITEDIVELGKTIGLEELDKRDIKESIVDVKIEPEDIELMETDELEDNLFIDKIDDEDNGASSSSTQPELTVSGLKEAFENLEKVCDYLQQNDPDGERSESVIKKLQNETQCYRLIYKKLKQNTGSIFH